ncbi:NAD(P)-binding protein, partial [Zopfia rhizophila CBS 207.26]
MDQHHERTTVVQPREALKNIIYIQTQILEVPVTVAHLFFNFLIYDFKDAVINMFSGKSFNPAQDIPSLAGKVILVTGGNTGLGKQTILYLSQHSPARVYLAARTASKAQSAIADIKKVVPDAPIEHLPLDLTSFASIKSAAETFRAKEQRLDLLINNAGVMATPPSQTTEGYENQFGTNHMGHALFTKLLMPILLATAEQPDSDVRIVNLTSMGHILAPSGGLIFDQEALGKKSTWARYGQSKLSNILFTRELAQRYPQITSVSIHPGVILTDLYASVMTNFFMRIAI